MQSHVVYLPRISELENKKSLENLSLVEAIIYLFENGVIDGTIESSRKYMKLAVLMDKELKFNEDDQLHYQATSRERYKEMQAAHAYDARKKDSLKAWRQEKLK